MKNIAVQETSFNDLKFKKRGKVRDIYEVDGNLLIVASDRISAFDVVMNEPVPDKGRILTTISVFWFNRLGHIVHNHVISTNPQEYSQACQPYLSELAGRSMLVIKATPLPVECVVRGYITGSGWKEYQSTGQICGIELPKGMVESEKFSEPIFTPATKAEQGLHDENISLARATEILGKERAETVQRISLKLYKEACKWAESRGIIIADTKFEFGLIGEDLILIDELLTPDSSRFWPADQYRPGGPQPSFDKQYLRDWLNTTGWNKTPPPPKLPKDIIQKTREKYKEAQEKLIG
jgi:phosphoribosylaminoimidazole-succinocarboxamide synthase